MRDAGRCRLLAILSLILVLPGCWLILRPPMVVTDPATFAPDPGRCRGDKWDRHAIRTLTHSGARFGGRPHDPASDALVVGETLRLVPIGEWGTNRGEHRDARKMILRRRPRAAYAAFLQAMDDSDPSRRADAIRLFALIDLRSIGSLPGSVGPVVDSPAGPGPVPEREAALVKVEALLLSDPDAQVRTEAAAAFDNGLAGPDRPTWETVLAGVRQETGDVREDFLRLLATRSAPAADRIDAAVRYTSDWFRVDDLIQGHLKPENRALLESAFPRGPAHFRQAVLHAADDLEPPQPWLEGLVLLGLGASEDYVREEAAHLVLKLGTPSQPVLERLRALQSTSPWSAEALREHEAKQRGRTAGD